MDEPGVQVGRWRKSTHSPSVNDCVEVAPTVAGWAVRDSKLGEASPVLFFDHSVRCALVGRIKDGEFG